jgi:PAS domain S-box-containing protein
MRVQPLRSTLFLVIVLACLMAGLIFFLGIPDVEAQAWERYLLPVLLVFLVLILGGAAWLLVQHREVQAQLTRREQELDELVKARTAALEASEQRFAKIFRASPVGITLSRLADGLYREANDAYLAITGYSREELVGRKSIELGIISQADRARLMATLREQEHASGVDLTIHTKSGKTLDVLSSIELVEIDGETWMLTSTVDITAHKRLEAALAAGERKYRDLYDNSPDMYFVGLPTEQRILDCNQTLARALGYTREELIGRSTSALFEPASYALLDTHRAEFLAEHKGEHFDMRLQCKDGTLLDVLVSGTVEPDPAGGPPLARVTLHDITERRRLETQLRDSEERFRLIVQNSPDIIALYDEGGTIVYVSPAFELA